MRPSPHWHGIVPVRAGHPTGGVDCIQMPCTYWTLLIAALCTMCLCTVQRAMHHMIVTAATPRFKRCSAARVARLIGISQLHPSPNWESVLSVLCSHWANSAQSSIEVRLTPEPFTGYQPYPLLGSAASICGCNGVEHQLRGVPFGVCAEPEFAGNGGFGFWWVSRLGNAARTSAGLF